MYRGKRIAVLIAAAGSGQRMNARRPKQFLSIGSETILEKTLAVFDCNAYVDDIYVVLPKDHMDEGRRYLSPKVRKTAEGSGTRQQSVYNGLKLIDDGDIILIHDAARPYVTNRLIDDILRAVSGNKAAIPVLPVNDTVKLIKEDCVTDTPDRANLRFAQTPQAFDCSLIVAAHEKARAEGFEGTDDAQLVERLGIPVHTIPGDVNNIKITTAEDMDRGGLAGTGFDVHAFAEGRKLILGGVNIPCERGLLGHSDADVLTHALMDAILGALNLGDIGTNFPDTDEKYKDIKSTVLLEEVAAMIAEKGCTLENADITIVAEKPRMWKYIPAIKKSLAEALDSDINRISVKATTTEGLGFTGREEGIGAQAIVLLKKGYTD